MQYKNNKKEGIGAYPEAASTKTATRMANKTIDSPLIHQKRKDMRVKCIKELKNPAIKVGCEYTADRDNFGMYVRYAGGKHIMPEDIFRECFIEVQ